MRCGQIVGTLIALVLAAVAAWGDGCCVAEPPNSWPRSRSTRR